MISLTNLLSLVGYCLLSICVAAGIYALTRRLWLFAIASATASSLLLQLIVFLYLGFLDAWAIIAFVPSWFIGLGCAIAYFVVAARFHGKQRVNEIKN